MPPEFTPHIVRVRPGRTAQDWVRRTVAELKDDDPFSPVTLIAPNYYAGRQTRWLLACTGGYINVRSMLLSDVATQVVSGMPGQEQPLTPVLEESAVRAAICRYGGVLSPLAHHRTLHQTLLQLFSELRRQEVVFEGPVSEMAKRRGSRGIASGRGTILPRRTRHPTANGQPSQGSRGPWSDSCLTFCPETYAGRQMVQFAPSVPPQLGPPPSMSCCFSPVSAFTRQISPARATAKLAPSGAQPTVSTSKPTLTNRPASPARSTIQTRWSSANATSEPSDDQTGE